MKKSNQKTFANWAPGGGTSTVQIEPKVFCFFFSKKKRLLTSTFEGRARIIVRPIKVADRGWRAERFNVQITVRRSLHRGDQEVAVAVALKAAKLFRGWRHPKQWVSLALNPSYDEV